VKAGPWSDTHFKGILSGGRTWSVSAYVIITRCKFHEADFIKEVVVSSCPFLASALFPYLAGKCVEQVCLIMSSAALIRHL
jgi:hypothetical protein